MSPGAGRKRRFRDCPHCLVGDCPGVTPSICAVGDCPGVTPSIWGSRSRGHTFGPPDEKAVTLGCFRHGGRMPWRQDAPGSHLPAMPRGHTFDVPGSHGVTRGITRGHTFGARNEQSCDPPAEWRQGMAAGVVATVSPVTRLYPSPFSEVTPSGSTPGSHVRIRPGPHFRSWRFAFARCSELRSGELSEAAKQVSGDMVGARSEAGISGVHRPFLPR